MVHSYTCIHELFNSQSSAFGTNHLKQKDTSLKSPNMELHHSLQSVSLSGYDLHNDHQYENQRGSSITSCLWGR